MKTNDSYIKKKAPIDSLTKIILLLGAPNDRDGKLSVVASDRVKCAANLYFHNENVRILCTGGFGEHFNKAEKPHAWYTSRELINKGIAPDDILEFILSSNTVEDFRMAKSILEKELPDLLFVITSDFHMRRARILHDLIINYPNVIFIPARSCIPEEELSACMDHELKAIRELEENDFVLY